MIRLHQKGIHPLKAFHRIIRKNPQIRTDPHALTAVADPKGHGLCRVMGNFHGIDRHILDGELSILLNLNKERRIDLPQLIHTFYRLDGSVGCVYGNPVLSGKYPEPRHMVRMLMGQQNAIHIAPLDAEGI